MVKIKNGRIHKPFIIGLKSLKSKCLVKILLALGCCILVYKRFNCLAPAEPTRTTPGVPTSTLSVPNTAPAPAPPPGIPCQWIVLTGDSNIRKGYLKWADLEKQKNHSTVLQAEWKKLATPTNNATTTNTSSSLLPATCQEGDWRWVDREMVLLSGTANSTSKEICRIVTLKFLTSQILEIQRLSNLLQHSSYKCPGYELENILPTGFARPKVPDTVYLSHGFWGLPNEGKDATGLDCATRFQPHIALLTSLISSQSSNDSVTWQTLFPINAHPRITNTFLAWDYKCQLEMAQQHQLSDTILDLYRIVEPRKAEMVHAGDYHFKDPTFLLGQFLSKCCGGWDSYWANP